MKHEFYMKLDLENDKINHLEIERVIFHALAEHFEINFCENVNDITVMPIMYYDKKRKSNFYL